MDGASTTFFTRPELTPERQDFYRRLEARHTAPLWEVLGAIIPPEPRPGAVPVLWHYDDLRPLLLEAGRLLTEKEAERRVLILENPGLRGLSKVTGSLYTGLQLILPGEVARCHRHATSALRFVLEGDGAYTAVEGERTVMHPGDFILTPSWTYHDHGNPGDGPMVWLDGLDIPIVGELDAGFFEFGPEELTDRSTPHDSRSERLWAYPGLRPVSAADAVSSPLMAYRWAQTDAALQAQLELDATGHAGAIGPGHAGVRFTNPTTGRDALPTLRTEMHRLLAGTTTVRRRDVGSAVWQVFSGSGTFELADETLEVTTGDLVAVPSWCPGRITATTDLDLFAFGDAPVYEALHLARSHTDTEET
jgi:gentisate 1,2-dioxygenase